MPARSTSLAPLALIAFGFGVASTTACSSGDDASVGVDGSGGSEPQTGGTAGTGGASGTNAAGSGGSGGVVAGTGGVVAGTGGVASGGSAGLSGGAGGATGGSGTGGVGSGGLGGASGVGGTPAGGGGADGKAGAGDEGGRTGGGAGGAGSGGALGGAGMDAAGSGGSAGNGFGGAGSGGASGAGASGKGGSGGASTGGPRTMGYVGCSMSVNVAQGYQALGATHLWPPVNAYNGKVVQNWTNTNDSAWQAFDQQKSMYGTPTEVWVMICIFSNMVTFDETKQIIANVRQHAPGAKIHITGQPLYAQGLSCDLAGNGGPEKTDMMAQMAGEDASLDVTYAGTFGPLTSSQRQDSCHANSEGQRALGQQAIDKFGR